MKRSHLIIILGTIAAGAVFLSACASQASASLPEVIKVQNVGENGEGTLNVVSRETVKVVPDMAKIVYGITTENEDAAVCQQENTEKLNEVIEYLKWLGYDEGSIQTSDFSLNPRYDWSGNTQKLVGYEMTTRLTLTNVPVDDLGSLISDTVGTGANEIYYVSYFSSKYDECYQEALKMAVESARAKAETLAAAGGQKLGAIVSMQEYSDSQSGRYIASGINLESGAGAVAETAAATMDMAVMPGEMEVSAQVSVDFALAGE